MSCEENTDTDIVIEEGNDLPVGSWIQHRILTMVWDFGGRKHPRFRVTKPALAPTQEDVEKYVAKIINVATPDPMVPPTPWDIEVGNLATSGARPNHPRILVLQLDSQFEWQFTAGSKGVSPKVQKTGEDSGLHFVDSLGMAHPATSAGAPDGCRVVYWSIHSRPEGDVGRGFDFHIDLIDPESRKHMPTIFDPNVPDSGGSSIP
ncbi:MAG: hypothetical protein JWR84_2879 [Caulobacter sp.]|nr:hypothetical protein [Caulobacter sp.]